MLSSLTLFDDFFDRRPSVYVISDTQLAAWKREKAEAEKKAAEEEEEYWRTHTYERWKRDLRAWYRKKTNRETRITGAQRLAEEADEMAKGEQELAEQEELAAKEWENYQDSDEDDDWMPEGGTNL